jgi:hypothetical protein
VDGPDRKPGDFANSLSRMVRYIWPQSSLEALDRTPPVSTMSIAAAM